MNPKQAITWTLLAATSPIVSAQIAQGPAAGSVSGGVHVFVSSMPAASQSPGPSVEGFRRREMHPPPPVTFTTVPLPLAPEGANALYDSSVVKGATRFPPVFFVDREGPQYSVGWDPPDPQIAAGPRHLMIGVNKSIRVCDKEGRPLKEVSAEQWHSYVLTNAAPLDPIVEYDHIAGRWLMLWIHQGPDSLTSYFLLSASDTDDPLGGWSLWALPADVNGGTYSADYPDHEGMGFDSTTIVIASNQYAYGQQASFSQAKIRVLAKAQLYSSPAGPVQWNDFWSLREPGGLRAFNIRPANHFGHPSAFLLAEIPNVVSATYAVLYRITGAPDSPAISAQEVPVTAWTQSPRAEQPAGGSTIDSDVSLLHSQIVARDSTLWIIHTVASGTLNRYTSIRYLSMSALTGAVLEDVAFGAEGYWYYFPTIITDKDHNVAVAFSRSSLTEFPSAYMTWRLASDPPGLRPSVMLQSGRSVHISPPSFLAKWGDYMGAAVDPVDGNNFWLLSEYAGSASRAWGTWIAGLRTVPFSGPRVLAGRDSVDFGSAAAGTSDTASIRIVNAGSGTLLLTSISSARPSFSVAAPTSLPVLLPTYDSLHVRVAFTPSVSGHVYDTLSIVTNDASNSLLKIPLQGEGFVAAAASGDVIYGAAAAVVSGVLVRLDTLAHAASAFGPLGIPEIRSLSIRLRDNAMFGIAAASPNTILYRLDATSGHAYNVGVIPRGDITAITWAPWDTLYGGATSGQLFRINPGNKVPTPIGAPTGIVYGALAFDRREHRLWAIAGEPFGNDTVYTIDPTSGIPARVGTTGFAIRPSALAMTPAGVLYGLVEDVLVSIDRATGRGRTISSFGVDNLRAIAIWSGPDAVETPVPTFPVSYMLDQNFPNPFNPTTTIRYELPTEGPVSLVVTDLLGRIVATLVNERKPAGIYAARFSGAGLASGVYFYRLAAGSFVASKKMLIIR